MENNFEQKDTLYGNFIFPEVNREIGEITRVAETFGKEDPEQFTKQFLEKAKTSPLIELSEEMWSQLENTDSYDISPNDWSSVEHHAVEGHPDQPRDWRFYKAKMESGEEVASPIIFKQGDTLHLVAGNTRLMVARALGIIPKALLVELDVKRLTK